MAEQNTMPAGETRRARTGDDPVTAANMPATLGSFCTGILGLDRAVAQHFDADLAWYSEIEPAPITVIEREHPGVPNLGDLKQIDWADVPPVDVMTAGYPCQPFSSSGKRKGADDPRHLWPFILAGVRALRPGHLVLENVRGHLTMGFDTVLRDLAEAGFDAEWCLLRASDVGAPHARARIFVVATDSRRAEWRAEGRPRREARDAPHLGHERAGSPRGRWDGPADCRADDPNPHGRRLQECPQLDREAPQDATDRGARGGHADRLGDAAWGDYAPAIRRWEHVLGRPAPRPVDGQGRLDPPFVEWMMGYPEGWTAELGRVAALKALGNAVVTQQALAACDELAPITTLAGAVA